MAISKLSPFGLCPISVSLIGASAQLGGVEVLSGINFTAQAGCITVVLGANGAGKSSLLSAMVGVLPLSKGRCKRIEADGTPADITRVGYVLQKPVMLRRSVAGNIDYAMAAAAVPRHERDVLKRDVMAMMKLDHLSENAAFHMSHGERQRLAVARVLAMRPGLLMLDEATNSLDELSTNLLEKHVRALADDGMPVCWVTHSHSQALRLADRIVNLEGGRITSDVTAAEYFA